MALASSRVICSREPVNTTVLPATGESEGRASIGSRRHLAQQRVEHLLVMRLLEELDDRIGHDLADAADGGQLRIGLRRAIGRGFRRLAQGLEVPKWRASSSRVVSPTCGMPSAKMKRLSAIERRAAMAANRFLALVSPQPSRFSRRFRLRRVARFEREDVLRTRGSGPRA